VVVVGSNPAVPTKFLSSLLACISKKFVLETSWFSNFG
jgi:hypothetical protein